MKIKNTTLVDLIWMSVRYCIGRHTITAAHHAGEIANIIYENPDILTKWEIERLIEDINNEVRRAQDWGSKENRIENDYIDLIPWIKLANALDTSLHKKIVCEWVDDNGMKHVEEDICFPYPARVRSDDGTYEYFKAWTPVKAAMCGGKLTIQAWIPQEYIKEIKDI